MQEFEARFADPYVHDAKGARWDSLGRDFDINDLALQAKQAGHDGLVVHNVVDPPMGGKVPAATTIAALKRGTVYDPATGNLIFSNPKESALISALAGEQMQQPSITPDPYRDALRMKVQAQMLGLPH